MKKIYTLFLTLIITGCLMAQTPQSLKYQAVARDASGDVVADQAIGMQISILQSSVSGTAVYVETFAPTTNEFGLINLNIGAGTVVSGDLTTIDWSSDTYFVKVEMDITGGTTYEEYGTSQLLSVPYALHAKTAENLTGTVTETDPVFTAWDKTTGISITESQISDLDHFTNTDETDQVFTASVAESITASDTTRWGSTVTDEADPLFTAWDKTTGISITESQINDLDHFTTSDETDPIFGAHSANGITSTNITNWTTAFGWGDHSLAGYLTSYTETDPVFGAHAANVITSTNITNWTTAYGWSDHSAAGYLTNYTETDPVFGVHAANGITSTNITNWTTAYGWGDHSTAGYLTSYTETDPIFGAHAANGVTSTNITNWTTAYGWDDHSTAGYITDGNTGWDNSYGFITASSSELLTNKSGDISMWTNDAGYLTDFTEADPIFTAWDKSTGISITENQISDFGNYESAFTKNTAFNKNFGNSAGTVTEGNDSRLSDARTPVSHAVSHTDGTDDIQDATSSQKGLMTATYATKLEGIAAGAEVNIATNLSVGIKTATALDINSSTGTNVTIPAATTDEAGLMTNAQFDKLSGIETGANVTDATNVNTAGAVMESDFNAGTFLYATSDNTPQPKTVSETKTILSLENVENTALSTWAGSGNITSLGTVTSGTLGTGAALADVTMSLGSDADGDIYYRSGSKLTRLPTGTDDQVLTLESSVPAWKDASGGSTTYTVGDFALGGIVFWVDETGQHGLVCAKTDQNSGVRWYAGFYGNTQAKGDGPLAGEMNTAIIIASQVAIGDDGSTYAARICAELQITEGGKTYGDWYLPSKEELNLMYQNKATIDVTANANGGNGFASDYYWSSTEISNGDAWGQYFGNGYQSNYSKSTPLYVRAIRAF